MQMLKHCDDSLIGLRDRALLALGFAGAFRRSELVALEVADLEVTADGFRVTIRRSKTDQKGEGQEIAIPRGCRIEPVKAIDAWLAASGITSGSIFRPIAKGGRIQDVPLSGHSAAAIVKRYAKLAGLDPTTFAGHSLRAGFLTSAAKLLAGDAEPGALLLAGTAMLTLAADAMAIAEIIREEALSSAEAEPTPV